MALVENDAGRPVPLTGAKVPWIQSRSWYVRGENSRPSGSSLSAAMDAPMREP